MRAPGRGCARVQRPPPLRPPARASRGAFTRGHARPKHSVSPGERDRESGVERRRIEGEFFFLRSQPHEVEEKKPFLSVSSPCAPTHARTHRATPHHLSPPLLHPQVGFYCPGGVQVTANRTDCGLPTVTTVGPGSGAATDCVPTCAPGSYRNSTMASCEPCPLNSYCEGGPQPGIGNIVACTPPSFTASTGSSTPGACQTCAQGSPPLCTVTTCAAGYYAATPTSACTACGLNSYCPGGPQTTPLKTACTNGLTTDGATTASTAAECVRVCPAGQYAPSPLAACTACLSPYYCPGGSQADGPLRNP